jgi:hypothetical protein
MAARIPDMTGKRASIDRISVKQTNESRSLGPGPLSRGDNLARGSARNEIGVFWRVGRDFPQYAAGSRQSPRKGNGSDTSSAEKPSKRLSRLTLRNLLKGLDSHWTREIRGNPRTTRLEKGVRIEAAGAEKAQMDYRTNVAKLAAEK